MHSDEARAKLAAERGAESMTMHAVIVFRANVAREATIAKLDAARDALKDVIHADSGVLAETGVDYYPEVSAMRKRLYDMADAIRDHQTLETNVFIDRCREIGKDPLETMGLK